MRATRFALESRLGRQLAHDDPSLTWIPTFASDTIARFRKSSDGKTPREREQGKKWVGDSLEFGERFFMKEAKERTSGAVKRDSEPRLIEARYLGQHARTGAMIGITTDCERLGRRLHEAERWDQTGWQDLKGVPWDLRPTGVCRNMRSMLRLSQAQPRQSRERAKVTKQAQREREQCHQDRKNEGALHPRGAQERKNQIRGISSSNSIRDRCSRCWVHPQPREKKGHELQDEFEERSIS